jgi:hypothetical protein
MKYVLCMLYIVLALLPLDAIAMTASVNLYFKISDAELSMKNAVPTDIKFEIVFENKGREKVSIYPKAAYWSVKLGWYSPSLDINISGTVFKELRSYYGPPGQPPGQAFFEKDRVDLKPDKRYSQSIQACWLPNPVMTKDNLKISTLDPENMDGLKGNDFTGASVLVLGTTCKELLPGKKPEQVDFLRGKTIIFFNKPGDYLLKLSYSQKAWSGFFKPDAEMELTAAPVKLRVL